MAQGSQPGVVTGLLREDAGNNVQLAGVSDVWREKKDTLSLSANDDDTWTLRVRDNDNGILT